MILSGAGSMQSDDPAKVPLSDAELLGARDTLQLMLIEYGDVHIETLGQLLRLTRSVEEQYSRISARRYCS